MAASDFDPDDVMDKSGADAVTDKFERLIIERGDLRDKWKLNTEALLDAVAAGRLFGVEIDLPPDIGEMPGKLLPGSPKSQQSVPQANLFEPAGDLSIREAVIDQLKMAGKKGIKAATLRRIIENMLGRQLHYKTIGMTLYRLSEKGQARRDGVIWFHVP